MKQISIVTPCYNEEENVGIVYNQVKEIFSKLKRYSYEHIFIDNASKDKTVPILKKIAKKDKSVKIIVNARNFGHIRSPYYALLQAGGDAVIIVASDLQDPPAMIPELIKKWEEGFKIVLGVKKRSKEPRVLFFIRKIYYNLVNKLSDTELIKNYNGFGLYDRKVIGILKDIDDPYPYFRGLIAEIGLDIVQVEYVQEARKRGATKNNFYTLYDIAMLGITNHSKIPLRFAVLFGFIVAVFCLFVASFYLIYKLLFWEEFIVGTAPAVIGFFFFGAVQLIFIGIIGEYIGSIHTQVLKRPLVVEKERINF
jgi:glycosyltransferase involved in cell wall biosynthesis